MVDKLYSHSILVTDASARWLTPKAEELYKGAGAIHRTVGSERFLRVLASRNRLTIDHELLSTPHSPLEVSLSLSHRPEMTGKNLRAHRCKGRQRLCVLRGQQSLHTETAERSVPSVLKALRHREHGARIGIGHTDPPLALTSSGRF